MDGGDRVAVARPGHVDQAVGLDALRRRRGRDADVAAEIYAPVDAVVQHRRAGPARNLLPRSAAGTESFDSPGNRCAGAGAVRQLAWIVRPQEPTPVFYACPGSSLPSPNPPPSPAFGTL